jgi:hypothetical protein
MVKAQGHRKREHPLNRMIQREHEMTSTLNSTKSEEKKMARISSKITYCTMAFVIALAISHSTVMAQGSPIEPLGFGIEGTWDLETTFVDCTTDEPLSPPGRSLVSYVQGGVYIEEA